MISKDSKISFALALLDIAKEENKIKKFYNDSKLIIESLEQNNEMIYIIDDAGLKFDKKKKIISSIYKENIDNNLLNSMFILAEKNKFRYWIDILNNLISYLQIELNIKEGIIYSTIKISKSKLKEFETKLSKHFDSNVILRNYLDYELIAGFRIVVDDVIIEDSVKLDLENMKRKLLNKGEY